MFCSYGDNNVTALCLKAFKVMCVYYNFYPRTHQLLINIMETNCCFCLVYNTTIGSMILSGITCKISKPHPVLEPLIQ